MEECTTYVNTEINKERVRKCLGQDYACVLNNGLVVVEIFKA